MISIEDAKDKLRLLAPSMTVRSLNVMDDILDGDLEITREETYVDPASTEYMTFVEERLSSDHLQYLDTSQSNGIWGGSTTEAFQLLADTYGFEFDGAMDSMVVRALCDGTKVAKRESPQKSVYQMLKDSVLSKGYKWDSDSRALNLVGVRGYLHPQGAVPNTANLWNDTMFVAWVDSKGKEQVRSWVCSCDPGYYYYRLRPLNAKGCAHLKEGQWWYQRGIHRHYPALVQAAATIVRRSNNGVPPKHAFEDTGWFGINIHSGYGGYTVYNSSAGCQVILSNGPNDKPWKDFYTLVNTHPKKIYGYTLLNSSDLV